MAVGRWLEHYDPGIPRTIRTYPKKTLVDFFRESARSRPDATAIVFKGRKLSWSEIDRASDALAHSLSRLGIGPGDRVALLLPNSPQFVLSELGIWKTGAIIAPQSLLYVGRELLESFAVSQPETVITLTPYYERIKEIQSSTTVKRVIATNIKEYLPALLRTLFTLAKEKKEGHRIELRDGDLWLQDLIRDGEGGGAFESRARPEEPAGILMSGGTTGTPKGVASAHQHIVMSGVQLTTWLREVLDRDSRVLVPLPLFHVYACYLIQSAAIIEGATLVLVPNPRDIPDVVATIAKQKPTIMCGVPTLYSALMSNRDVASGKADFRSLRLCSCGAAALMTETKRRFEEMTGCRMIEGYSLSEATVAVCSNPYRGENKVGSVGMPLPDVAVRIVDTDDATREMRTGEVGEILMDAPQLMLGYWKNPEETARAIRKLDDGRDWLFTGDLGYLDEDGYLFIVDRKKDLIKTSGLQVWPREVEEVIAEHPSVAEVGVAGLPDPRKGEIVAAWVVPSGDTLTVQELREFCAGRLAPYKIPSRIEIRTELPKSLVGKVLRRVLVAEAKAEMADGVESSRR